MNQLPLLQQQRNARQQQMMLSKVQASTPRFGAPQSDAFQVSGGTRRTRFDDSCDPSKATRARFQEADVHVSVLQTQGAVLETSGITAVSRPHVLPSERFISAFDQVTAL